VTAGPLKHPCIWGTHAPRRARLAVVGLGALLTTACPGASAAQASAPSGARPLQEWIEKSGDFPAEYRVRDDNTDRLTGVQFTTKIPPLRNVEVPPPSKRWGRPGPS
jgi:hypothetical protein